MTARYSKYNRRLAIGISAILLPVIAFTFTTDPYWLFHRVPVWGQHNRVLALKMRFTKALQVIMRRPDTVIIGSSRVYRGMPTSELHTYNAYNLGISSLRITEATAYISHVIRWTPVKRMVLGLDYFMFEHDKQSEAGFDPGIAGYRYLFKAFPASLLTSMSVLDSITVLQREDSPDGYWTWSGFKVTYPRPAERMQAVVNTFYNRHKVVTSAEYGKFEEIIEQADSADVQLKVFISPLNRRMISRMEDKDVYEEFTAWKSDIMHLASKHNTEIYDFSENNPFFADNTTHGSTTHWIDPSHYSPRTGSWILKQIGLVK